MSATTWKLSPACGTPCSPSTSTGVAGPASVIGFAAIVEHRAHLAEDLADDERIVDAQRSLLDQHGRDRTASAIEFGFEHDA